MENKKEFTTDKQVKEFSSVVNNYLNDVIRKQYYKEWRKNNKDKIKKYNEKFWKKQAEKLNSKEQ